MSKQSYRRTLSFHNRQIDLDIIRQRRKSLAIHVFPGNKPVELRVPLKCSWLEIDAFLTARTEWTFKALEELASEPRELEIEYTQDSTHFYLGEIYPLSLSEGKGRVRIEDGKLLVRCLDPCDPLRVRTQLDRFYRKQSLPVFCRQLAVCTQTFPAQVKPSVLRVRKMRSRWGSCSHDGEMCLNTLLVRHDIKAINFVITHELCHLVHFHHSRAFYRLLDQAMPAWREAEKLLRPLALT